MSIHPHDVRELLGPQSLTTPVSDEQVERMVAVLNACRAQHALGRGDLPAGGRGVDRRCRGPSGYVTRPLTGATEQAGRFVPRAERLPWQRFLPAPGCEPVACSVSPRTGDRSVVR